MTSSSPPKICSPVSRGCSPPIHAYLQVLTRTATFASILWATFSTQSFLGIGKNFRLLMQSSRFFCFFSPDLSIKISHFSNCPYDFNEILHSYSTPKGAPACANASKSYGWDVRNISQNSLFSTFFDFLKNSSYDSNEIFVIFYTIILGFERVRRKKT